MPETVPIPLDETVPIPLDDLQGDFTALPPPPVFPLAGPTRQPRRRLPLSAAALGLIAVAALVALGLSGLAVLRSDRTATPGPGTTVVPVTTASSSPPSAPSASTTAPSPTTVPATRAAPPSTRRGGHGKGK